MTRGVDATLNLRWPARGLYAITEPRLTHTAIEAALRGGAVLIQYRDKGDDGGQRMEEACALRDLCHAYRVPLIVNDDVELAYAVGADGVHLGRDDADVAAARAVLGPHAIIGASCYNTLERADRAVAQGANYVAFGRFFPSYTKPGDIYADLDLLRAARARYTVPIAAIGGITPDNAPALIAAGADLLAVVQGVFAVQEVEQAAMQFAQLFASTE